MLECIKVTNQKRLLNGEKRASAIIGTTATVAKLTQFTELISLFTHMYLLNRDRYSTRARGAQKSGVNGHKRVAANIVWDTELNGVCFRRINRVRLAGERRPPRDWAYVPEGKG